MKKLLLIILFLFVPFINYSQGAVSWGPSSKAVVKFTDGTTDVGSLKEVTSFFVKYSDPLEVKFKSNSDDDYRLISSNEIQSVRMYNKKNEKHFTDYYPIRVRRFDKKYTFSDKYYVSFYPKANYNGIDYVTINTFLNSKYLGNSYFFAVGDEGYYFYFDQGYRRTNRESAQFMMLLDKNCEAFQDYVKQNYLETSNYKADYKAAVREFRQNKKTFIKERKAEGYKTKYAKLLFKSEEYDIYFKQLMDKYIELCQKK